MRRRFTPEHDAWFRERAGLLSIKDMTEQFNQTFGENRSEGVVKVHCNRELGIRFLGNRRNNFWFPIGTEKIRSGYIWVKVADEVPENGEKSAWSNWRQKSHVVWEQHHGTIPPGHTIVFLDGDHMNTNIENLYAVSGRVLREMSKKSWWSSDPDRTLAAIKWCELFYTIKDVSA